MRTARAASAAITFPCSTNEWLICGVVVAPAAVSDLLAERSFMHWPIRITGLLTLFDLKTALFYPVEFLFIDYIIIWKSIGETGIFLIKPYFLGISSELLGRSLVFHSTWGFSGNLFTSATTWTRKFDGCVKSERSFSTFPITWNKYHRSSYKLEWKKFPRGRPQLNGLLSTWLLPQGKTLYPQNSDSENKESHPHSPQSLQWRRDKSMWLDHGGSWVQIPSEPWIFPSVHWMQL